LISPYCFCLRLGIKDTVLGIRAYVSPQQKMKRAGLNGECEIDNLSLVSLAVFSVISMIDNINHPLYAKTGQCTAMEFSSWTKMSRSESP
jgi:hypothetical protein